MNLFNQQRRGLDVLKKTDDAMHMLLTDARWEISEFKEPLVPHFLTSLLLRISGKWPSTSTTQSKTVIHHSHIFKYFLPE